MMKAIGWALAAAVALSACGSSATAGPTQAVVVTQLTAEISGTLVNEAGCLRVANEGGSYLLLWPPDNAVTREGKMVRVVTGVVGGVREEWQLRLGDVVLLGGGMTERLDETLATLVPPGCAGPYWVMGQIAEVVATAVS